ncbi:YdjY domain-containing protein [Verrucomicrobium spinosum]|uniref:YdjY domain-containing protein n=1 Tax=Verrucomicrobium spinosum TaxID=2736 RepID=UPI0001744BBF|nr:YdjY domain-containing protein [Verrucomicrobium spinosum]
MIAFPRRFTLPFLLVAATLSSALLLAQDEEPTKQPSPNDAGKTVAAKEMAEAQSRVKKVADNEYDLGGIKINSKTRQISVPCVLNMTEGLLEYVLVHEHGKTHESLLRTSVSPTELNVALLLAHYEPNIKEAAQFLPEPTPMTQKLMAEPMSKAGANQITLSVQWKDKDGKEQTAPVTRWIHEKDAKVARDSQHWTYTGSMISQTGFAAQFDGSMVAIYFDLISLVNFPVKENANDDLWKVETAKVPPVDTPVTLVISPKNPGV